MSEQLLSDVERWGICEVVVPGGPRDGNPFTEIAFGAKFAHKHRVVTVDGFYDGDGHYRVRFMPDALGAWTYETTSDCDALDGVSGAFRCIAPGPGNHGPIRVRDRYHFAYADGAPYYQFGTTCYAWLHQGAALEEQTLETLRDAPFNKLRMCVFPKHYVYNRNEPEYQPFPQTASGEADFTRFCPEFFRHVEERVVALMDQGIEADIILFHPYDRWGYATMDAAADDRYLRYIVARLSAFRNVWWSMANEYDLMKAKTMSDWDRFFRIVQESDPYHHLRGIHNCRGFYDHSRPWVTHTSVQHQQVELTDEWRRLYGKPVVIDETKYEGNVPRRWGNIPAEEMVRKFWEGTVRGGYVGHGETYLHPQDILWWSKGGALHGESPERIAFLRRIVEQGPPLGLDPVSGIVGSGYPCAGKGDAYLLTYFGMSQPAEVPLALSEGDAYQVDVIDTWAMTVTTLDETLGGQCTVTLPDPRPYLALRLIKVT